MLERAGRERLRGYVPSIALLQLGGGGWTVALLESGLYPRRAFAAAGGLGLAGWCSLAAVEREDGEQPNWVHAAGVVGAVPG